MKSPYFRCLRPYQWVKNLVVFMPLVFGQKLFDSVLLLQCVGAFIAFSLIASSTYVFNDVNDLLQDQKHHEKRLRPIAAGAISPAHAKMLGWSVLILGFAVGGMISRELAGVLFLYLVLNFFYSRFLKNIVILDVFTLAVFFVLRICAGTVVTHVAYSFWMIFELILLAMFLGFNKRRQEIQLAEAHPEDFRHVLLKYSLYFIDQMISVITSSLVVVYMLYCIDHDTVAKFGTRQLILSIPFVYYGIFRYLYLVHKIKMGEDPTRVLVKDRMIQINLVLWIIVCILIIYHSKVMYAFHA